MGFLTCHDACQKTWFCCLDSLKATSADIKTILWTKFIEDSFSECIPVPLALRQHPQTRGSSPIFTNFSNWTYDHETQDLDVHWRYKLGTKFFSTILSRKSSKSTQKIHFFLPGAPFSRPQINCSYLGFPTSVLGHPKHIGPGYDLCGPLYLILWPILTIQYRCDTSRDVIWCHDFGPTTMLWHQNLKLCTLTSLGSWSSFKCTPDLDILSIGKCIQFNDLSRQFSAGDTPDMP